MPNIRHLTTAATPRFKEFVGSSAITQPVRYRTWGIPTGAGWFSMPWKWNFIGEAVVRKYWWVFGVMLLVFVG